MIEKHEVDEAFNLIDTYIRQLRKETGLIKRTPVKYLVKKYGNKMKTRTIHSLLDNYQFIDEIIFDNYRRIRGVGRDTVEDLCEALDIQYLSFKKKQYLKDLIEILDN
jgi:hypothetical protein